MELNQASDRNVGLIEDKVTRLQQLLKEADRKIVVLNRELDKHNVTANLIAPGVITTESYLAVPEKMRVRIERAHAMRRAGDPEDIAHAVAYFASDEAKFTTGQVLIVGGGIDLFTF